MAESAPVTHYRGAAKKKPAPKSKAKPAPKPKAKAKPAKVRTGYGY